MASARDRIWTDAQINSFTDQQAKHDSTFAKARTDIRFYSSCPSHDVFEKQLKQNDAKQDIETLIALDSWLHQAKQYQESKTPDTKRKPLIDTLTACSKIIKDGLKSQNSIHQIATSLQMRVVQLVQNYEAEAQSVKLMFQYHGARTDKSAREEARSVIGTGTFQELKKVVDQFVDTLHQRPSGPRP